MPGVAAQVGAAQSQEADPRALAKEVTELVEQARLRRTFDASRSGDTAV